MTTYNTYAEAKIANPDSEIYVHDGKFATKEFAIQLSVRDYNDWYKCHPKDYCMTLEEFLADGHKLVNGDLFIGARGAASKVADEVGMNIPDFQDKDRYILRAKALENQAAKVEIDNTPQQVEGLSSAATTKRATKVEYVKVEYNHIWEIMKMQSEGVDFYIKTDATKSGYGLVQNNPTSLLVASSDDLYRRIEKEVDWRDIVKQDFAVWFDEGKVGMKMAFSEENYLEMCRVTLRAIGEIE